MFNLYQINVKKIVLAVFLGLFIILFSGTSVSFAQTETSDTSTTPSIETLEKEIKSLEAKNKSQREASSNLGEQIMKTKDENAKNALRKQRIEINKKIKQTTYEISKRKTQILSQQSDTFNVGEFLSVGNEANLTVSAEDDKDNLIYRVINMMITMMGIVAILLYVIAGFFIITASDENQLQKGKTILIYTSLGIAVAFSSYILVQIILSAIFTVA